MEHKKSNKMGRTVTSIDKVIGENIKTVRVEAGLSLTQLADKLDITFQQVQKYELGKNRVAASTLFRISKILDKLVDDFYVNCSADDLRTLKSTKDLLYMIGIYKKVVNPEFKKAIKLLINTHNQECK